MPRTVHLLRFDIWCQTLIKWTMHLCNYKELMKLWVEIINFLSLRLGLRMYHCRSCQQHMWLQQWREQWCCWGGWSRLVPGGSLMSCAGRRSSHWSLPGSPSRLLMTRSPHWGYHHYHSTGYHSQSTQSCTRTCDALCPLQTLHQTFKFFFCYFI